MTPREYLNVLTEQNKKIDECSRRIFEAREKAASCPPPSKELRRPATSRDIVRGAIIWHEREEEDGGDWWSIVEGVLCPNDSFKAYIFEGCRYGLDGAYIEEPNKTIQPTDKAGG